MGFSTWAIWEYGYDKSPESPSGMTVNLESSYPNIWELPQTGGPKIDPNLYQVYALYKVSYKPLEPRHGEPRQPNKDYHDASLITLLIVSLSGLLHVTPVISSRVLSPVIGGY